MLDLLEQIQSETPLETERRSQESLDWFKLRLRKIRQPVNKLLTDDDFPVVARPELGKMYMYYYDALHKDTLPYFDKFPLVVPIRKYATGFIGLNLHYIAPRYRMILLNEMFEYLNNTNMDESTRFRMTYDLLKSVSRLKYFRPCLKEYLYSQIRSQFSLVPSQYWELVAMLPMQKFTVNANTVYSESRRKFT